MQLRIGNGWDFHCLIEDPARPLLLGAVEIQGDLALKGHSDADLLLHALCDALAGALGLPDIGEVFADTDAANKNLDSRKILEYYKTEMQKKGWQIMNLDLTLIGEKPRLKAYKPQIQASIAHLLAINTDQVGIKATTTEKMGALGRAEGLGCMATVLLFK